MKTITSIYFSEISSTPRLIKDFLASEEFAAIRFSKESFERQIRQKQQTYSSNQRDILVGVLKEQYKNLPLNEKQKENLESLEKPNTFTVVTGHQLNLFTGPVFFIYKIMQTIKTVAWLKNEFPELDFVPLFWMATEDHDFEEINHFKTEQNLYQIKAESGGAVGRIVIDDVSFIDDFEDDFKDTVYGTEMIRWLREAYQKGRTLSEATRILVDRIFSDYGLLIIDGDHPALKKQMVDIFKDELLNHRLEHSTKEKVDELAHEYGKVQVNPREINLFYLNENRDRIDVHQNSFVLNESVKIFTREEILQDLELHPEKFSPNALMRPVFQETVLPNVAYIGGNAEVMYWLELQDYVKHLKLPFPVLIPRNSMLFLKQKIVGKIGKSGLALADFFSNYTSIRNELILKGSNLLNEIEKGEESVKSAFENLKIKASETAKTFGNLVAAEENRQLKSFEKMRKRLLRAEKIKQSEKVEFLENLYSEIHPKNTWQERVYNFSVFYSSSGNAWLQTCYEECGVEDSKLIIIEIPN